MQTSKVAKFCVYVYRDPRNGKGLAPIYVGKGSVKRSRHTQHLWRATNLWLKRKIAKIESVGLRPVIDVVAYFDREEDAFSEEMRLIALFGRFDQGKGPLCNATDGGDGAVGAVRSEKERRRLRDQWAMASRSVNEGRAKSWADPDKKAARIAAMKAACGTDGWKARRRNSYDRLSRDPEFAAKISRGLSATLSTPHAKLKRAEESRAKWRDPSFKAKTRAAIGRAKNRWWIYADGQVFGSAREAAEALGVCADCVTLRCRKGIYRRELKDLPASG